MFEKSVGAKQRVRTPVRIRIRGCAPMTAHLFMDRDQRPIDLLNDQRAFVPVEMVGGAVSLVQKSEICEVAPVDAAPKLHKERQAEPERPRENTRGQDAPAAPENDPYGLLGVAPDADLDAIHVAYRGLLKELHPDRVRAAGAHGYLVSAANDLAARVVAAHQQILAERRAS